jgi:SAM-dependent methyltransferase
LQAQADILAPMVFREVDFGNCTNLLEVGSGVGAQTRILLERFPQLQITCVDSSALQLAQARINLASFGNRVHFVEQDGCNLSLSERFDAAFVCWTLEHVSSPIQLLVKLKEHLQPGARVYVTEVFNSSLYTSPGFPHFRHYFEVMSSFQRKIGGNPDVGIELGNLLTDAGFSTCSTRFDGFYLDRRSGEKRKFFTAIWNRNRKRRNFNVQQNRRRRNSFVLTQERRKFSQRFQSEMVASSTSDHNSSSGGSVVCRRR